MPILISEVSELFRYFDDTDLGQEVQQASSCGDPSGFADFGPTATVFVPSVVPPDTEIDDGNSDDEHPELPVSSESECGANCDDRDSESSDCNPIFSLGSHASSSTPVVFLNLGSRLLSRNSFKQVCEPCVRTLLSPHRVWCLQRAALHTRKGKVGRSIASFLQGQSVLCG